MILCEGYHIIRVSVFSVRMSIKTRLKTKRIKEYKNRKNANKIWRQYIQNKPKNG